MKNIYLTIAAMAFSVICFAQNIPIDFESTGNGAGWSWNVFQNGSNPPLEIVTNPYPSGINMSPTVARFTALQAGAPFAGCESLHGSDIGTFTITPSNNIITIMVYKTKISDVGIKLVTAGNASLGEIKVANTLINQWEQITFDFSAHIGGMTYDQIVIFPDFIARPADDIIYFDNIWGGSGTGCATTTSSMNISACSAYSAPSGTLLTTSGIYEDTIPNVGGCDSIITIDLSIAAPINITTSLTGATIMSNSLSSDYQWLDCDNNYAQIAGAVNQAYMATTNGNYAVEITKDGCVDTSACVAIAGLGIDELGLSTHVYPNPNNGIFTIKSTSTLQSIQILNIAGQAVRRIEVTGNETTIDLSDVHNGVYFLNAQSDGVIITKRILKQ